MRSRILTLAALSAMALTSRPARAQDIADKLQIHGSLNAAYGQSDSLSANGIPKNGTTNYRALALQFRYDLGEGNALVTQFLHRKLGSSPLQGANPDVQINWAFWQHRSGDFTLRLGRNPLPRGFFNETRFIGTVLPLYRTGQAVYGETFETIDGAVLSHRADLGAGFNLESNAFAGGSRINVLYPSGQNIALIDIRLERMFGTQLFLTTPIPGVRLGGFAAAYNVGATNPYRQYTYLLSAEAVYEYGYFRAEGTRFLHDKSTIEGDSYNVQQGNRIDFMSGYMHAGIKPTSKLTFIGEINSSRTKLFLPEIPIPGVGPVRFPDGKQADLDAAVGVSWAFNPTTIFKFEAHQQRGHSYDTPVPLINPTFGAGGPVTQTLPWSRNRYLIASIAVSF